MDAATISAALATGFEEADAKSGLTPLDRLIQAVNFEGGTRESINELLPAVALSLVSETQWRSLDLLITQGKVGSVLLGETIEGRVAHGQSGPPEAWLWAARCAKDLGATLSRETLEYVTRPEAVETSPREWVSLVISSCDWAFAASLFEEAPLKLRHLRAEDAYDMLRTFKRGATDVGADWTFPISRFLKNLTPEIAFEVAQKAELSIGSTFKESAHKRLSSLDLDSFPTAFDTLFEGLDIVRESAIWSRHQALEPQLLAA